MRSSRRQPQQPRGGAAPGPMNRGQQIKWGELEVQRACAQDTEIAPPKERRRWRQLLELWRAESKHGSDVDDVSQDFVRTFEQYRLPNNVGIVLASINYHRRPRMRDVVRTSDAKFFLVLLIFEGISHARRHFEGVKEQNFFCQRLEWAQQHSLYCPVYAMPFVQARAGQYILLRPRKAKAVFEATPLCANNNRPQQYLLSEKAKKK